MPSPITSPSVPFLPNSHQKTLFLNVFKTIIYTGLNPRPDGFYFTLDFVTKEKSWTEYVILRPGLDEFLQAAKNASFEIVTFTTWPREIMSRILHEIDPTGEIITHRLFQDSWSNTKMEKVVKDLMLTRRLPGRTVVVDHEPRVNLKTWSNTIKVSPFTGNVNDVELRSLLDFFKAQGNFIDLRRLTHVSSCDPPMSALPLPQTTRKTLFLDLDETLICHVSGKPADRYDFVTDTSYVTKRPGLDRLLQTAAESNYEIIIFTAAARGYAAPIIDQLDPSGLVAHRLYRDSCIKNAEGKVNKDLTLTGRSLDRSIIIEDRWYRVVQPENVVWVRPFTGDTADSELTRVLKYFEIEREYGDLRGAVSHVNDSFF